jgi:hypothetical protein
MTIELLPHICRMVCPSCGAPCHIRWVAPPVGRVAGSFFHSDARGHLF